MTDGISIDAIAPRPPRLSRFLIVVLAVPALLLVLSSWLWHEYDTADGLRARTSAAIDWGNHVRTLTSRVADAESGQRGFVMTADPNFVVRYAPARSDATQALGALDHLIDRPASRAMLVQLRDLTARKFAEMDRVMAIRRASGEAAAIHAVAIGEGKRLMDDIRRVSGRLLAAAEHERGRRSEQYRARVAAMRNGIWVAVAGVGVAMLSGGVMFWRQEATRYSARLAAYTVAERNRSILDSTVDAIAIFTPEGRIETINAAAAAMLGYASEDVVGRDVSVLMRLVDRPATFHERVGLVDGRLTRPYLSERKVRHRDGHAIEVDIALGVMRLPGGDHIVASVRDVSERKRIDRVKDELMSTVSHELRTPLTSVIGALGLLRAGTARMTPAEATRLIEIAENNSHRLIRLINDMLDIDRIQSRRIVFERRPADLRGVLARACEGIQGLADARGVAIVCHTPDAPVMASVDADRVLQVLANLASNAVNASPAHTTVTLSLATRGGARVALMSVDDEGPGIPAEFRERIFGRFQRARHEGSGGSGLGLAISREIVEHHDGRIWFEDRAEGGTRFAFVLDLLHDAAATVSDAAP